MRFRKKVITRREHTSAFETENILQTADLYRKEGKIYEAVNLYRQAKDYDRILSISLTPLILERYGNESFISLLEDLSQCSYELKTRYPLSMLNICWGLKTVGLDNAFDILMDALYPIVSAQESKPELLGEWLLLSSFKYHPDSVRMASILKEAEPLFAGKCSQVILPQSHLWFSIYVPCSVYYTKKGEADREAAYFEEYIALYSRITGGHGCGAGALFRSSLAYQRGDLGNAEIYAYKALYLAQGTQQSLVLLGVIQQLGQIALHKADAVGWQNAVKSIAQASASLQNSFTSRAVSDILCAFLLCELQQVDDIADWIKNGDFSEHRLSSALVLPAVFLHALYLLHRSEFTRVVGFTEAWFQMSSESNPLFFMLISLVTAAGYMQLNDSYRAWVFIRQAAMKALPDGLIFPFASFSWILKGLSDKLIEKEHPELLQHFKQVKSRFAVGWRKLYKDLSPELLPESLTIREREVALLASRGLHNSEIAKKLNISENTIRAHLRAVFQKLAVDRRAKLAEKLKEYRIM